MSHLITAICSTYGRPELLEEAIQSFLLQAYKPKELIILNDLPNQKLIFEHPEVRIINLNKRLDSFGEKCSYALSLAQGEYVTWWDDDDINLPWYLEFASLRLESWSDIYFAPNKVFYSEKNEIKKIIGAPVLCGTLHRTKNLRKLSPFPAIGTELDLWIYHKLEELKVKRLTYLMGNPEIYFIFRWDTGNYHLQGWGVDKPGEKRGWDKAREMVEGKSYPQEIKLKPHWKRDYVADVKTFLSTCGTKI